MGKKRLFLIGAPKCGTTSIAEWLGRHSLVQTALSKEPGYFRTGAQRWILDAHSPDKFHEKTAHDYMIDADAYERQFNGAPASVWRLDASTDYFSDPGACARIQQVSETDDVKILCILRDPVERMHSEFRHTLRDNIETLDFKGALDAEEQRASEGYQPLFFHIRRSQYAARLARWRAAFPEENMLIVPYSALNTSAELAQSLCAFLEIPVEEMGDVETLNASRGAQKSPLQDLRKTAKSALHLLGLRKSAPPPVVYPTFSEEEQRYAFSFIREDVMACIADPLVPTAHWEICKKLLQETERDTPEA